MSRGELTSRQIIPYIKENLNIRIFNIRKRIYRKIIVILNNYYCLQPRESEIHQQESIIMEPYFLFMRSQQRVVTLLTDWVAVIGLVFCAFSRYRNISTDTSPLQTSNITEEVTNHTNLPVVAEANESQSIPHIIYERGILSDTPNLSEKTQPSNQKPHSTTTHFWERLLFGNTFSMFDLFSGNSSSFTDTFENFVSNVKNTYDKILKFVFSNLFLTGIVVTLLFLLLRLSHKFSKNDNQPQYYRDHFCEVNLSTPSLIIVILYAMILGKEAVVLLVCVKMSLSFLLHLTNICLGYSTSRQIAFRQISASSGNNSNYIHFQNKHMKKTSFYAPFDEDFISSID